MQVSSGRDSHWTLPSLRQFGASLQSLSAFSTTLVPDAPPCAVFETFDALSDSAGFVGARARAPDGISVPDHCGGDGPGGGGGERGLGPGVPGGGWSSDGRDESMLCTMPVLEACGVVELPLVPVEGLKRCC